MELHRLYRLFKLTINFFYLFLEKVLIFFNRNMNSAKMQQTDSANLSTARTYNIAGELEMIRYKVMWVTGHVDRSALLTTRIYIEGVHLPTRQSH